MPRKAAPRKTEQVNVRLAIETLEAIEAYKDRQLLRPTTTMILQAAADEWLARHGQHADPQKPRK